MFSPEALWPFILMAFLVELTPGPNMGYLAIISVRYGAISGYVMVAGIALGLFIVGLLSAFGLAEMISRSVLFYEIVRLAGVGYLIYLALHIFFDKGLATQSTENGSKSLETFFQQGLITNLLNPKAYVFYMATLPQFAPLNSTLKTDNKFEIYLFFSIVYVCVATVIHLVIVAMGSRFQTIMLKDRWQILSRKIMSVCMGLIALWLYFSTIRHSS